MFSRISHLLAALGFLLVAANLTSAQPPSPVECPAIDVEVPSHELAPGEEARFTLRITPKKPESKFQYRWFLSEGQPLTGQNTDTITVKRGKASFIDATVHKSGGPDDSMCPVVSTDRATWAPVEGEEAICPKIQVTGPAGIPNPGDLIPYTVQLIGNVPTNVRFKWSVSSGEVAEGQGTDKVKVDADWMSGVSVTATVEVLSLPDGCPNTASETMAVSVHNFDPVLTDQYSIPVGRVDNTRLAAYATEMNKHPNSFAYILEYFLPGTKKTAINKKLAMTKAALVKAGLEAGRFQIEVVTGADQRFTRLYRVPPGANNPTP